MASIDIISATKNDRPANANGGVGAHIIIKIHNIQAPTPDVTSVSFPVICMIL
jgi:hypothetical protein